MLDRFLAFFRGIAPAGPQLDADDPRVAAAALMHHVMEADGVLDDAERRAIRQALAESYGVGGAELDRLAEAGEAADREAIDLYAFTSVLKRRLNDAERREFVRLLWEIVYADGQRHELEDHTIWRVAELLDIERGDRIAARRDVAAELVPEERNGSGE